MVIIFTYVVRCSTYFFPGINVSVVLGLYFCDGRTDTILKNNDHLFGRDLVVPKTTLEFDLVLNLTSSVSQLA